MRVRKKNLIMRKSYIDINSNGRTKQNEDARENKTKIKKTRTLRREGKRRKWNRTHDNGEE